MEAGATPSLRIGWVDLPETVRTAVAPAGSVSVTTIAEGFSPGFVGHVVSANSDRFLKICTDTINPRTSALHQIEAKILITLSPITPAPLLTDVIDVDGWVGLATEWIDPVDRSDTSWLAAARDVWQNIGAAPAPTSLPALRSQLQQDFLWSGWRRLAEADCSYGSSWADQHAVELLELEEAFLVAVDGDKLVHGDLRADNIVVGVGGKSVAVDWPSAAIGNPLFDGVMLVGSVAHLHGEQPSITAARLGVQRSDALRSIVIGVLGHYAWASSLGNPPGIPGVRGYQAALRTVFERWVRDLWQP
jgi:hypothetical protein